MNITIARKALKKFFGYDTFRPMQDEIIQTIYNKQDCLVLMPTGGGKSICYQIPAITLEGCCIVISPLIALMKDQVEGLKANGVAAEYLNSSVPHEQQIKIVNQVMQGQVKLLYVSPEKLVSNNFINFLKQIDLSLIAVDEAHCISSWGHDFRPEYTKLSFLKTTFAQTPLIALTATADKITRKDILSQLQLSNPEIFIASFDRPNLSLTVLPGQNRLKQILDFLKFRPNQPGIVYCLSRKSAERLAEALKNKGYNALYYHAGMPPKSRAESQEAFTNDKVSIICATVAFGMGIDKSNIRWVIHYNMPKNIEGYYQEIGRAGRDGLKSDTLLFYSFGDVIMLRKFIEDAGMQDGHQIIPTDQLEQFKEVQRAKLQRMQQYAEAAICRRSILLNYFGESLPKNCSNCDVCKNPPKRFDGTIIAQKALSAVARLKEKVALGMLIDVLRGSARKEIMDKGYDQIKTYGAGREIPFRDWQQYILQMINMGLLEVAYDQKNALKLTKASKDVLFRKKEVSFVKLLDIKKQIAEQKKRAKPKTQKQLVQEGLFEFLKQVRKKVAEQAKLAPYLVFTDTTLQEMAERKPTNRREMANISGVGAKKLTLYGSIFARKIIEFITNKQKEGFKIKGGSYLISYQLYQQGLSAREIANTRNLNPITIYSHLAYLYEKGYDVDLLKYITEEELQKVLNAMHAISNTSEAKKLHAYLKETIPYHKIRLAISYYRAQEASVNT